MKKIKIGVIFFIVFYLIVASSNFKVQSNTNSSEVFSYNQQILVNKTPNIIKETHQKVTPFSVAVLEKPITKDKEINKMLHDYIDIQYSLFLSYVDNNSLIIQHKHKATFKLMFECIVLSKSSVNIVFRNHINIHNQLNHHDLDSFIVYLETPQLTRAEKVFDKSKLDKSVYQYLLNEVNNKYLSSESALEQQEIEFAIQQAKVTFNHTDVRFSFNNLNTKNNDLVYTTINVPYYRVLSAVNPALISHVKVVYPPSPKSPSTSKPSTITFTGEPGSKRIALTFDDGPSAYTMQILNSLARYNAKATFFVLGSLVKSRPDVIREIHNRGHEIGNHSYNHPRLTSLSNNEVLYQINTTNSLVEQITGQKPRIIRPPYGSVNDRIRSLTTMPFINWNIDTKDWKYRSSSHLISHIKRYAKNNGIVLMHDLYGSTANALDDILAYLHSQGYTFVTVSELVSY